MLLAYSQYGSAKNLCRLGRSKIPVGVRSETQQTLQYVGFRSSTQPTHFYFLVLTEPYWAYSYVQSSYGCCHLRLFMIQKSDLIPETIKERKKLKGFGADSRRNGITDSKLTSAFTFRCFA